MVRQAEHERSALFQSDEDNCHPRCRVYTVSKRKAFSIFAVDHWRTRRSHRHPRRSSATFPVSGQLDKLPLDARRADVTGLGAREPRVEGLALPKSVESGNLSFSKTGIRRMSDSITRRSIIRRRGKIMRKAIFVIFLGLSMLASANLHADDWPMYGQNLSHTFSNNKSLITPFNVSSLTPAWFFPTGDAVSASPAVVNGVVYVGSWDGFFYALNADPRAQKRVKWQFTVDCQYTVIPIPPHCLGPGIPPPDRTRTDGGIITSSAAVVNGIVYFGAGKTLYALQADSGKRLWQQVICGNPRDNITCNDSKDPTRIFSSPAVFFSPDEPEGLVFVGHTADGANGYRGGFEAFNATTGALRWRFEVDKGQVIGGRGCGSVWSSAAVDTKAGLVFFGTGDCSATPPSPYQPLYHEAIIALNARTGILAWFYQPRQTDKCDFDFGASPNIIDLGIFGRFVGLGGKDGTYYLLNESGYLVWKKRIVFGGSVGGFFGGAAFDGQHIFSATAVGDPPGFFRCSSDLRDLPLQEPSMHALNLYPLNAAGGSILWERLLNQSFGATSLSNGVVFSGLVGIPSVIRPALKAYDARNGWLLKTFPMPGAVNSTAVPVGKMLFVPSGNSTDGTGGGVTAFTLP
jgi:outer membrane protein assembly factor BamB